MKTQKTFSYCTSILKLANGKFILVGSVPVCLDDKIYELEQDCINELYSICGMETVQLSNGEHVKLQDKTTMSGRAFEQTIKEGLK
ncbi:MAG TPA: hypothetical protein VMV32_02575 [Ignavibacteriaceae bacterium]|nr:hypothetical protein [Ignavibacteriaceae bacterium]